MHLFFRTEVEAVRRHRASLVADVTSAEAKSQENEGGGWGLETDGLGHDPVHRKPVRQAMCFVLAKVVTQNARVN